MLTIFATVEKRGFSKLVVKRFIFISLILLGVFQGEAFAQKYTVSGKVTDKSTGKPVDFATVVIEGSGQ